MPDQSTMQGDWTLWERLLTYDGAEGSSQEVAIDEAIDAFIEGITSDPAYQPDALVEGTETPIVASRVSALECKIKAVPGTEIHIGDLVECLDEKWLVMDLYIDKIGIINGTMWICNDTIHFQNNSAPVHTRNCIIDDGSYSRKTSDPIAYVPVNTYKLYLSIDAETKLLFIDKRLAFGVIYDQYGKEILEVYKTIGIDKKSRNLGEGSHLMMLTMQRDVYHENVDSIALNLCDVYVPPEEASVPQTTGSCVISGRDAIRIGTTRKYHAVFTDAQGVVDASVTPIWTVAAPTGVVYEEANGVVSIPVPLLESLIGAEITITVTSAGGLYGTYEKKVQVVTVG